MVMSFHPIELSFVPQSIKFSVNWFEIGLESNRSQERNHYLFCATYAEERPKTKINDVESRLKG